MSKDAPAFQFFAQDFICGCLGMSDREVGVYIKLLAMSWFKNGVDLECCYAASSDGDRDLVDSILRKKFKFSQGKWNHEKLIAQREYQQAKREAGSKGGSKRQANTQANFKQDAKQTSSKGGSKTQANLKPSTSTSTSTSVPKEIHIPETQNLNVVPDRQVVYGSLTKVESKEPISDPPKPPRLTPDQRLRKAPITTPSGLSIEVVDPSRYLPQSPSAPESNINGKAPPFAQELRGEVKAGLGPTERPETPQTCFSETENLGGKKASDGVLLPDLEPASKSKKRFEYPEGFEKFWNAYPAHARTEKQGAFKAWKKAVESISPDSVPITAGTPRQRVEAYLVSRASDYAASEVALTEFTKYPATWLNKGCWNDSPDAWTRRTPAAKESMKPKNSKGFTPMQLN